MKALSLWQPWASLVVAGVKGIETRSWSTNYRGSLVIHAAKREGPVPIAVQKIATQFLGGDWRFTTPRGAAIGLVELLDVLPMLDDPTRPGGVKLEGFEGIALRDLELGDFRPGRFAWILGKTLRFDAPSPCRGRQGLFLTDISSHA